MFPFALALNFVALGFMLVVIMPLVLLQPVPAWTLWLFGLSAISLLVTVDDPEGRAVVSNWLEKGRINTTFRLITFAVIAIVLFFSVLVYLLGAFFSPEVLGIDQSLQEFTLAVFGLLVAGSGLCFGALRAFAIFAPDDFPKRKNKYTFDELKRKLFSAGINLFYAAILLSIATLLKLVSEDFMATSDLFPFTLGFVGNIFVFVLVAGTFIQALMGINTLLVLEPGRIKRYYYVDNLL